MKLRSVWLFGALVVFCAAVMAGCSYEDSHSAVATARAFMEAGKTGDRQALESTLTEKARQQVKNAPVNNADLRKRLPSDYYTIGEPEITDDTAQVPVSVKGAESDKEAAMKLRMRREQGEWRIYGMTVPGIPGGPDLTVDFENPAAIMGEIMKQMPQIAPQAMKAMGEGFKAMGEGFKAAGEGFKAAGESVQRSAEDAAKNAPHPAH